jgi:hypothetical protein
MLEKDVFGKLRRSREDEFFAAREQELIDKLRRRAALEAEVGRMAESKAAANAEILASLEELGYTRETLTLLHLVPLVYVAWAEDFVTGREREQILQAARLRGIDEGSVAFAQLSEWLTTRPSDEFFEKALGIIHTMLEALPPEEESAAVRDLVAYSKRIASASGGLLGLWGAVSAEEQAAIDHVAAALHAKYDERAEE